ncbi:MAG TPA: hypothetical protein DHK64_16790, partial [Rhodobiaceae bacterium]|nr:hypothetical protein [Rhodobiaceae bacterium]
MPPGFGATTPSSASRAAEPSGPAQLFPTGVQPAEQSVRVLGSVPGRSGSGIEIGSLSGVDAATAGLLSGHEGFGADMWRGASRADIDSYLSRLPVPVRSP